MPSHGVEKITMLFRTNQETRPAIDLFRQASLDSIGQWCGPFARPRIHQPLFKTDVESLASHAQETFFARPIRKCGIKTRQPEVSAVVTELLVSNKNPHAMGQRFPASSAEVLFKVVSLEPASVTFNWLNLRVSIMPPLRRFFFAARCLSQ